MRQEYTNSSIAGRIEFCNPYFVQIFKKTAISEILGFRIDNPFSTVFGSFE
jgi:hypothetical protein